MAGSERHSLRPTSTAPNHHCRPDERTAQRSAVRDHVHPDTDRSEDVSHAVAQEVLRRLGLEGRDVPSELEDFIDCYAGRDRQLTLRLALT
jgi:hypothetical protein